MLDAQKNPDAVQCEGASDVQKPESNEHENNTTKRYKKQDATKAKGRILTTDRNVWCVARRVINEAILITARNGSKPSSNFNFKPLPSLVDITATFLVDPSVGEPINLKRRPNLAVGAVCGTRNTKYVTVFLNGEPWRWHRLAFKIYNGRDPIGIVDHIDGNPRNNAKSNLRDVDYVTNARNRHARSKANSGVRGVSWCKSMRRWMAHIGCGDRVIHLGKFLEKKCAVAARKHAEGILFNSRGAA